MARQHNENLEHNLQQTVHDSDEENEAMDPQKLEIFEEVAAKMKAMSNLYMNLTEEEIDMYQEIAEDIDFSLRYNCFIIIMPINDLKTIFFFVQ